MEGRDARMVQRSKNARFALEAREKLCVMCQLFRQHFDRDLPTELRILGEVNFSQCTSTDLVENFPRLRPIT